jgi:hypothetical protein
MVDRGVIDTSTLIHDRYVLLYVISVAPMKLPTFEGGDHVLYTNYAPDAAVGCHNGLTPPQGTENGFVIRALLRAIHNATAWLSALRESGRLAEAYAVNIDGKSDSGDEPVYKYREVSHEVHLVSASDMVYRVQGALMRL